MNWYDWLWVVIVVVAIGGSMWMTDKVSKPGTWSMPSHVPPPEVKINPAAVDSLNAWLDSDEGKTAMYAATGSKRWMSGQSIIVEATTLEDERSRFIRTGKVINRFRPMARRRIRVVPR